MVMAVVVMMLMVMMMFAHGSRVSPTLWIEGRFDFGHLDRKF